jgi:hypothetical protein
VVIGPGITDEWHGSQVLDARLPPGKLEDRRVGIVGRSLGVATVAYWIGNYIADIPARPGFAAGKVRMRVTHVFERRRLAARDPKAARARSAACGDDCRWLLVQSHMSQPITDDELTKQVFGAALISARPLQLDCSDGRRSMAPAAAPRSSPAAPSPPAAGSR